MILKIYRKLKLKCRVIANRNSKGLTKSDIKGYRTILRMLYHPHASTPLKDPDTPKYFIRVPRQDLDLIIDYDKAEIVNTNRIYEINIDKKALERAVENIKKEVTKQRNQLEKEIRGRKENTHDIIARKVRWY